MCFLLVHVFRNRDNSTVVKWEEKFLLLKSEFFHPHFFSVSGKRKKKGWFLVFWWIFSEWGFIFSKGVA